MNNIINLKYLARFLTVTLDRIASANVKKEKIPE
jgi:hypothetical protein